MVSYGQTEVFCKETGRAARSAQKGAQDETPRIICTKATASPVEPGVRRTSRPPGRLVSFRGRAALFFASAHSFPPARAYCVLQQYFGREACTMKNGNQGGERRQNGEQRGDQSRQERGNE